MILKIIPTILLNSFKNQVDFDPLVSLQEKAAEALPVDYFQFYNSISSVYSSKIEGEQIDYDSYFKHKFLKVPYQPDYTKKSDDLFNAYEYILTCSISENNLLEAHKILSQNLLPNSQRGQIRNNLMFVLNDADRIEYVAAEPFKVREAWKSFFEDIETLQQAKIDIFEAFYYAAMLHLVFVKIHPMQDGNGRTARLLEKWFLLEKLGEKAISIELEKNYYTNRQNYYDNIKKLGLDYEVLDYSKALDFLFMTISSLKP